jgi:hypothetical protein
MYAEIKKLFFWVGMKCDVVQFVARCLECQQVKAEHHHPTGLLQPHDFPMSKWEVMSMDFVVGLPLTSHRHSAHIDDFRGEISPMGEIMGPSIFYWANFLY